MILKIKIELIFWSKFQINTDQPKRIIKATICTKIVKRLPHRDMLGEYLVHMSICTYVLADGWKVDNSWLEILSNSIETI